MSAAVQAPAVAARPATYPRAQTDPPQRTAALAYAGLGLPVFPLQPGQKIPFPETEGCKNATTGAAIVRAFWREFPAANVGIATGQTRKGGNVVAIDFDVKPAEGIDGRPFYAAQPAAFPATLCNQTSKGGFQQLYSLPPDVRVRNSTGELAPGVDTRGDGGYIVAPPSRHPSGTLYTWAPGAGPDEFPTPTPAPPELIDLLVAAGIVRLPDAPPMLASPPPAAPSPTNGERWSTQRLLDEARAKTATGTRNNTGFWLACQLRDERYTESEADSVLRQYQQDVTRGADPYKWSEARASLRSAYSRPARDPRIGRAQQQPRQEPSAPDDPAPAPAWDELHQAAANADIDLLLTTLQTVLAERDALQAWKDKALEVLLGTGALDTADRVGLIALQQWIEEQNPTPGEALEVSQQAMAARWSVSPSTVSRWLDKWDAMEITDHDAGPDPRYPVLDRQGQQRFKPDGTPMYQNRTYLACNKRPFEVEIAVLKSPPGKKGQQHGGKRECPHCGAAGTEQEVIEVRHCRKCHTMYHANGNIIAIGTNVQTASGKTHSCMMQVDHDDSALRAMADDLRTQAPDSPRIAATVARNRRRYQVQTLIDAADAHHYAPNLHDASRSPVPSFARPPSLPDAPLYQEAAR